MKHQTLHHIAVYRFRRFCRAGYAAFCSMHRVVNIGCLASYIADRQLKKSALAVALCMPLAWNGAMAQTDDLLDEQLLPTLDITAPADSATGSADAVAVITRSQLQGLAVSSVGELLEQLPGLDLRTRGGGDVQGDLTMRGGSFDQMIILLNGVNLTDAQTGHHNLDIPIDLSMVDRVEIIPPSALMHYGMTSFCGAVNIVTGESADKLLAQVSGGSFGQLHASAGAARVVGPWTLSAAASYHQSNGYMPNTDYSHGSLYLLAHRKDQQGDWLIQAGAQSKDFGSQAFYSAKYPDQFEATRTLMASVCRQRNWNGWQLEGLLYGRLHKDRFELFREGYVEAPSWYVDHNYHLSAVGGLRLRASRMWHLGRTTFGAESREDGILSTVLGDSLSAPRPIRMEPDGHFYNLGIARNTTNLFAEHTVYLSELKISGGLLASYNSMMGPNYGYALSADYAINQYWHSSATFGRSFRLPTFTDLYYKSATQISNPDLLSEVSHSADINVRYQRGHVSALATIYGRKGSDIIDWVRLPSESVWHSLNHADIDAFGTDIQAAYQSHGLLRRVGVTYSYCNLVQNEDGFISNYVLDYMRHKIGLDVLVSPIKELRLKLLADYHYREGFYTDAAGHSESYDPVFLLNAAVEYDIWHCTLFVEGYNLLNTDYFDYGGIPLAGISCLGGVRLKL